MVRQLSLDEATEIAEKAAKIASKAILTELETEEEHVSFKLRKSVLDAINDMKRRIIRELYGIV